MLRPRPASLSCAFVPLDRLTADQLTQWSHLSLNALEPNAYLCPEFVLPSLEMALLREPPLALIAEDGEGSDKALCGLAIFEETGPTRRFPLRHLRAYKSPHSFLTGFILRPDMAKVAATEMMRHLLLGPQRWNAVYFSDIKADSDQAALLKVICDGLGIAWYEDYRTRRAALDLRPRRGSRWEDHISRSRIESLDRGRARLEALGEVEWRYVDHLVGRDPVESFLMLENLGWKFEAGTSLRSSESHERFFHRLVTEFGEVHRVFFTELLLDGAVIASTCNLCVGDQGFAFKVAFDPQYAKMAPGLINELEFLRSLDRVTGISDLDSGAEEGSFIDDLWPERVLLSNGHFIGRPGAKFVAAGMALVRDVKRAVAG